MLDILPVAYGLLTITYVPVVLWVLVEAVLWRHQERWRFTLE